MSQRITITATGNVVNEPVYFDATDSKKPYLSMRLASTPSRYDQKKKEWADGITSWFDVHAYGALAAHAAASLHKGDPIVVSGSLTTREYTTTDGTDGSAAVINATTIGHDLLRGNTTFERKNATAEEIAESVEVIDAK